MKPNEYNDDKIQAILGKENLIILKEHCERKIESLRPLLLLCFTLFDASCQNSSQTNHGSW